MKNRPLRNQETLVAKDLDNPDIVREFRRAVKVTINRDRGPQYASDEVVKEITQLALYKALVYIEKNNKVIKSPLGFIWTTARSAWGDAKRRDTTEVRRHSVSLSVTAENADGDSASLEDRMRDPVAESSVGASFCMRDFIRIAEAGVEKSRRKRVRRIMKLVSEGNSQKEIAKELGVSVGSISGDLASIRRVIGKALKGEFPPEIL